MSFNVVIPQNMFTQLQYNLSGPSFHMYTTLEYYNCIIFCELDTLNQCYYIPSANHLHETVAF